jgi:ribosome-associated translation inhibitor RaiA
MAEQFITDITELSPSTQATLKANATASGMTVEEYLKSRGGVNPVTKKFGDSYNPNTDLSDAEYQAAITGKTGLEVGKALNAAVETKLAAYAKANPQSAQAKGLLSATTAKLKTDAEIAAETKAAENKAERQSAYDLLLQQFNQYGLGALVTPLKDLITSGASPSEFTIRLRESDAYKKRFAANQDRINKGLTAISEAEYLGLEDQYQNIMRNYGLPAEYYTRGDMGIQEGFNKFIANDVSAAELEDRVMTAQSRVMNANPEVLASLKAFYPDITNGDILAYTLNPTKALTDIKRKVTAAEIGGAATQAGLGLTGTRAEELGAAGITKQQAQQGFQTVAEVAPRGGQLAAIYGESPYTQQTAEQEVFGLAGSTEAAKQRKKLAGLERAAFSGQTGAAQGALGRERAGNF